MANKVIVSPKFTLQLRDFLRGAIVAVIASIAPIVQQTIDKGELTFNWKLIGITAIGSFIAYLFKNLLIEPAKVVTTYNTNDKAKEVAEDIKK